jgi:ACS family hexuronate transporter-like MFS transporter
MSDPQSTALDESGTKKEGNSLCSTRQRRSRFVVPGLRWWIVGLLLAATLISYVDRLTLSVLAPAICADLKLSNLQYADINVWFLLAYSFGQTVFGKIQDRIGTKRGLSFAMMWWSAAELLHAFTRSLGGLSVFRFCLGIGEGGHWPAAIKGVAEWFPRKERAFAMGIVNTGATLGSTIAPPLIVWLQLNFGWRATFIITGAIGFSWLAAWAACYQSPANHPWLCASEMQLIQGDHVGEPSSAGSRSLLLLLCDRKVLGLCFSRFLGDPVWWLYLVWLPLYFSKVRGLDLRAIGYWVWIPFLFADIGALLGGYYSGWLIRRGRPPVRARFIAIIFSALLTPAGTFVFAVKSIPATIALISVMLFAFQFWVNNVQTLTSDFFPNEQVASISGLAGTSAGIGAMVFTLYTGWAADHLGYLPIFVLSGFLVPAGTIALVLLSRTETASEIR